MLRCRSRGSPPAPSSPSPSSSASSCWPRPTCQPPTPAPPTTTWRRCDRSVQQTVMQNRWSFKRKFINGFIYLEVTRFFEHFRKRQGPPETLTSFQGKISSTSHPHFSSISGKDGHRQHEQNQLGLQESYQSLLNVSLNISLNRTSIDLIVLSRRSSVRTHAFEEQA